MIYFDNAATTWQKPKNVIQAVETALKKYGANPGRSGHRLSAQTGEKVFEARRTVAEFFGVEQVDRVIFTLNCTHALNLIIKGVLRKGDHAVISCYEHNSVVRPLYEMKARGLIDYTVVDVAEGDAIATVRNFENAVRKNTRLIVCTHASNVTGIRLPVKQICAMAHAHGVQVLLDAAQTAGVVPIKAEDIGFDYLCAAGHKSLYGPAGTGLALICSDGPLQTLVEGGTGSVSLQLAQPDFYPDRLESGTINIPGILGLGAGVDFVRATGTRSILAHEIGMTQRMYDGLAKIRGIRLYTKRPDPTIHVPVLCFSVGDQNSEETVRFFDEKEIALRGGFHCAPLAHEKLKTLENGLVRASVGVYNKTEEVYKFLQAAAECARS